MTNPATRKLPSQDVLTDAHLAAIGLVVVEWAALEGLMQMALCNLMMNDIEWLEKNPGPLILTTGMGAQVMIGLLKSFIQFRSPDDAEAFEKLMKKINKAKGHRDIVAHSTWEKGPAPGLVEPQGHKTVGQLKTLEGHADAEGIADIAHDIFRLGVQLDRFMRARSLLPAASPEMRAPKAP